MTESASQASPSSELKSERLEARVTPAVKELIQRAAAISGTTVTEFLTRSLREAAVRTIRDHETMSVEGGDQEAFVAALLDPPVPNARLMEAARKYLEAGS